ncbi:TPA: hypothetical protein U0Y22_002743, partial [Listeria monocytogenes]|nr:hypothetical protein [Listeria monocytogenes]HEM1565695.1 hypothetical protein [Listeria monocytogenes]HEM1820421.1 hypothetical protein [Listeria monocytogenes]
MGRIKVTINAEYIDNKLTAFGKSIEFKNKIVELKENDNCLFVRLLVVPGQELNENTLSNVYAINKLGEIQWQIKNVAPKGNNVYICAPLVGMDIEENDLFVTDFMGRRFEVNQENGEL